MVGIISVLKRWYGHSGGGERRRSQGYEAGRRQLKGCSVTLSNSMKSWPWGEWGEIDRGESSNKGQLYIRKAIWCSLSDEGQFQRRYHRSEFSSVSVPSRGKVRMNPFLNDWAADQAPANHSHRAWRSGVIMRICDAGKHASAGSSPTYLRPCLPSSRPNQIFL